MARVHNMQLIPQASRNSCWLACMKMLTKYELGGALYHRERMRAFMERSDDAPAAADEIIQRNAREAGMRIVPFQATYSNPDTFGGSSALGGIDIRPGVMEQMLDNRPFGMPCRVPAGPTRNALHVIVVRGYTDDDGPGPEPSRYWFLDPAEVGPTAPALAVPYELFTQVFIPDGGYVFTF